MSALTLVWVKGRCPQCGHEVRTCGVRDLAVQAVTEAIEEHIADAHPSVRMASVPNGETW